MVIICKHVSWEANCLVELQGTNHKKIEKRVDFYKTLMYNIYVIDKGIIWNTDLVLSHHQKI